MGINIISTKNMPYREWLQYRRQGIGGSDAGAICGMSPYASPITVWADKKGKLPEKPDNEAMRQGRDFEEIVARRFCELTGKRVRRHNFLIRHDTYPFMQANVDRLVIGEKAGLECKTASPYSYDKWKDGKIPPHYELQCLHYLAVTGLDAWYIACIIYGTEFVVRKIERDEEKIKYLEEIEKDFWETNILGDRAPEPDGTNAYDEVLKAWYPRDNGTPIELNGFDERIDRIFELNSVIDNIDAEKKLIEQEIKAYMQEAERAESNNYRVTWKTEISNRIDSIRLKKEQPEIYKKYLKQSESRRFSIKNLQEE